MAKPLLSPLPLFPSDAHLPSKSRPCPLATRTPRPRTHSGRRQASSSSRRSQFKRGAPSAAVLTVLVSLATEQARAYNLKAPVAPSAAFPLSTAGEPLLQCSDVPEFLCPVFSTTTATTTSLPVASSSSSTFPDTRTELESQQEEEEKYEKGDEGDTTELASDWSADDSIVARSTSLLATHSLLPAASPFFTPEDVDNNNERKVDTNAGASRQSIFGRHRSEFGFRPREDETEQEEKREKRDLEVRATSTATATATSTSPECSELYTSRTIPDRYELGNDGRWHKLSISSSCLLCDCTLPDIDDAISDGLMPTGALNETLDPSSSATVSASDSQNTDTFTLILPDGWDKTRSSAVYKVPLIVVASLLVAAAVTVAVWIAFFWRRRRRMALHQAIARDLEKRKKAEGIEAESENDYEDDDGGVEARNSRAERERRGVRPEGRKEKKNDDKARTRWTRGAAQWKAHVRWTHRRKRGRSSVTVCGGKDQQPRSDAISSGISLARSTTSSRAGSSTAGDRCTRGTRGSTDGGASLRGNEATTAGESLSDKEVASRSRSGLGSGSTRVRERESQSDRPSDHLRSVGARAISEHGDERYQEPGGSSIISHISRSTSSAHLPARTSDSSASQASLSEQSWTSTDYDRPPPDVLHGEDETQEPPAYHSRRSDDILTRATSSRRLRRDEKRAVTSEYVPAPEDCAPYSSSDEGGNESEREGESSRDSRRLSSEARTSVQMHVAVDDKHALARLAAYASAPPVPFSPPPPPPISPSPCSPPLPYSLFEPKAPPEPEWEQFEEDDYARALGLSGAEVHLDDSRDSPGAGPGPSTMYACSRSASPVSRSGSSPRASISKSGKAHVRSPSYYQHQHRSFPAPPAPVSSQLAYAPADAGLIPPPNLPRLPSFNLGYDHDDFAAIPFEGPSAPPFSPYDMHARGSYITKGGDDGLIGGPSAPPLFTELGNDEYRVGLDHSAQSVPSAPPDDEVGSDDGIGAQVEAVHSAQLQCSQGAEDEEISRHKLPEIVQDTGNDRNAVSSTVR